MITPSLKSNQSAQGGLWLDVQPVHFDKLSIDELIAGLNAQADAGSVALTGDLSILSPGDIDLLAKCESTVQFGLDSTLAAGLALLVINRRKLYCATHTSFACYVDDKCGFSRAQAYRIMQYAEVCGRLSPIRRHYPSEQQVRDMLRLRLSQEQQYRVWQAASFGGRATRQTFDQAITDVVGSAALAKLRTPREAKTGPTALRYAVNPELKEAIQRASERLGLSVQEFLDAAVTEKIASVKAPII